jgi:drug/metabolite transporter (DMT)-like permease
VISAVSFGFMALFASWTRDEGLSTEMLLFLRFGLAGAALALWMLARRCRVPRGRDLFMLIFMGGVLYAGMSMCYFHALGPIPAGLVALLLYLYPVIVTVLARILLKERLTRTRSVAIALAVIGLGLTTIGPLVLGEREAASPAPGGAAITPGEALGGVEKPSGADGKATLSIALGIGSALFLSAYVILVGPVTRRAGAAPAATIVMLSAAAVVGTIALTRGDAFPQSPNAWAGALSLAIVSTLIAMTAFLAGLKRIGAVRASTISTLEPITTVVVSALFLHEDFTLVQAIGGALILIAAVIIARSGSVENVKASK